MLKDWTGVKLYPPADAQKANTLGIPSNLFSGKLPKRLLLRIGEGNPKRPLVLTGAWAPDAEDPKYVLADTGVLRELKFDSSQCVALPAEIKRATARERLRYDRGTQVWLAISILALVGDGFTLAAALVGPSVVWLGVVAATAVLITGIIQLASRSGAQDAR